MENAKHYEIHKHPKLSWVNINGVTYVGRYPMHLYNILAERFRKGELT